MSEHQRKKVAEIHRIPAVQKRGAVQVVAAFIVVVGVSIAVCAAHERIVDHRLRQHQPADHVRIVGTAFLQQRFPPF